MHLPGFVAPFILCNCDAPQSMQSSLWLHPSAPLGPVAVGSSWVNIRKGIVFQNLECTPLCQQCAGMQLGASISANNNQQACVTLRVIQCPECTAAPAYADASMCDVLRIWQLPHGDEARATAIRKESPAYMHIHTHYSCRVVSNSPPPPPPRPCIPPLHYFCRSLSTCSADLPRTSSALP